MTPLQRHQAAVKAAATRRANLRAARMGGTAAPPPRPPFTPPPPPASNPWNAPPATPPTPPPAAAPPRNTAGGLWGRPQPTVDDARADVLVALENLYALQCKATGIDDEKRNAFDKYKKALTRALAISPDPLMRNEAETALRVAAMHLVKLTF